MFYKLYIIHKKCPKISYEILFFKVVSIAHFTIIPLPNPTKFPSKLYFVLLYSASERIGLNVPALVDVIHKYVAVIISTNLVTFATEMKAGPINFIMIGL